MRMGKRTKGWLNEYWRYFTIKGKKTRLFSYRNWAWKSRKGALDKLAEIRKSRVISRVDHYRITKEKFGYRLWII